MPTLWQWMTKKLHDEGCDEIQFKNLDRPENYRYTLNTAVTEDHFLDNFSKTFGNYKALAMKIDDRGKKFAGSWEFYVPPRENLRDWDDNGKVRQQAKVDDFHRRQVERGMSARELLEHRKNEAASRHRAAMRGFESDAMRRGREFHAEIEKAVADGTLGQPDHLLIDDPDRFVSELEKGNAPKVFTGTDRTEDRDYSFLEESDDDDRPVSMLGDVPEYKFSRRAKIYCQNDEDI